ncbi:hypothetical protein BH09BAC3_BH09BAC3_13220 [soil metagenome]
MNLFKQRLRKYFSTIRYNFFDVENFDESRFGKLYPNYSSALLGAFKQRVKRIVRHDDTPKHVKSFEQYLDNTMNDLEKYFPKLENIYAHLNEDGKDLLVKLIAFRIVGFTKVKLPLNKNEYWHDLRRAERLKIENDTYDPHFLHMVLQKYDLSSIGYDLKLYFTAPGIAIDFINEQYAYKLAGKTIVGVELGDVVLDLGGCWGDTALYFASKVGEQGKIYSFEFVPDNIKLFNINKLLNPALNDRIELVPHPVSDTSGGMIYFQDRGPSSKIEDKPFDGQTGCTTLVSVDDFVESRKIDKVDYIKMDIEGAESKALEGAINTIRRDKPKLAIAIYHSAEDFVNIPSWIMNLDLGYEIYLGHYTIHAEETVCFAKVK